MLFCVAKAKSGDWQTEKQKLLPLIPVFSCKIDHPTPPAPHATLIPQMGHSSHRSEKLSANRTFAADFWFLWDARPTPGKSTGCCCPCGPCPLSASHNSAHSLQFCPTKSRELFVVGICGIGIPFQRKAVQDKGCTLLVTATDHKRQRLLEEAAHRFFC